MPVPWDAPYRTLDVKGGIKFCLISNGRSIDCLTLTYATNESKKLKLHYKNCIQTGKTQRKKEKKTFTVNTKVPTISSSHKDSNREGMKSVFHHFCPALPGIKYTVIKTAKNITGYKELL
jgi:ferredoxin-like protein FixX